MSDVKIAAELRTEFGKGAARRLRRAHQVPAVLYGHGTDPLHLALPGHETMLAMKTANVLLTLDINGHGSELALAKHIQRDPIKGFIKHIDLLLVKRGEKVTVEVAIQLTGDAEPGTLVNLEHSMISVEADATRLPEHIEVSVEGLGEGTQIHARDLSLPPGVTLITDEDQMVVNIIRAPSAQELEGEPTEAAEGVEAGEAAAPAEDAEAPEGEAGPA